MEVAVVGPQQTVTPPEPAPATQATAASLGSPPKPRRATRWRRKTLCDITNLSMRAPAAEEEPAVPTACPDGGVAQAQLVKEKAFLLRLLEERNKIIQLSGAEIEKLRLANSELARANSQMMAELNSGNTLIKSFQHELACTRSALQLKTSELADAKKLLMKRRAAFPQEKSTPNQTGHQLYSDRAAQMKDGDLVDPGTASVAAKAGSVQGPGNGTRKRNLRSRSLVPESTTRLALTKETKTAQKRKSMGIPQPSEHKDGLFELEGVQLTIGGGGGQMDPESASDNARPEQASAQFLRRSSLGGRPPRQAKERVATYKELPINIKLRRP